MGFLNFMRMEKNKALEEHFDQPELMLKNLKKERTLLQAKQDIMQGIASERNKIAELKGDKSKAINTKEILKKAAMGFKAFGSHVSKNLAEKNKREGSSSGFKNVFGGSIKDEPTKAKNKKGKRQIIINI